MVKQFMTAFLTLMIERKGLTSLDVHRLGLNPQRAERCNNASFVINT
jgi:hypothetical protein